MRQHEVDSLDGRPDRQAEAADPRAGIEDEQVAGISALDRDT